MDTDALARHSLLLSSPRPRVLASSAAAIGAPSQPFAFAPITLTGPSYRHFALLSSTTLHDIRKIGRYRHTLEHADVASTRVVAGYGTDRGAAPKMMRTTLPKASAGLGRVVLSSVVDRLIGGRPEVEHDGWQTQRSWTALRHENTDHLLVRVHV